MNIYILMFVAVAISLWIVGAGTTLTGLLYAKTKYKIVGFLLLLLDLAISLFTLYLLGVFS